MKNLYFLCFFFLFSTNLFTQSDWDIFPYNQKTYFQNDLNELELYYNDSTEMWNGVAQDYWNLQSTIAPYGDCWGSLFLYSFYEEFEYIIDIETYIFSDSTHYYRNDFKFYQHAELGESWKFNSPMDDVSDFRITCLEKTLETFLGYEDSVKTFSIQALIGNNPVSHPFNDFEFKLSKTVGFIEFFPLDWFQYSTPPENFNSKIKKIYGFEKDTIYGFMNRFEDYFHHFESGDVYEWYSESWDLYEYRERWRWDSILTVNITSEGVDLEVSRTEFRHLIDDNSSPMLDTTWTTTEIVSETIEQQFFTPFFQSATQALYPMQDFVDFFSDSDAFLVPHLPKILPSGQIYEPMELYDLHYINLGNCNIQQSTDFSKSEHYKTGIGAVRKSNGGFPGFSNVDTLICHQKNGIWYGENCDPVLNTATNDVSKKSFPIQIIPNPAISTILVKSPFMELNKRSWQIFDYQGKLVKKGQFSSDSPEINVDRLLSGFYFLQIEINGKTSVEKFVKQ